MLQVQHVFAATLYAVKQHCAPSLGIWQAVEALVQARLSSHSPPEFCNAVSSGACCVPTLSLALLHECQVWPAPMLGCIHSAQQHKAIKSSRCHAGVCPLRAAT